KDRPCLGSGARVHDKRAALWEDGVVLQADDLRRADAEIGLVELTPIGNTAGADADVLDAVHPPRRLHRCFPRRAAQPVAEGGMIGVEKRARMMRTALAGEGVVAPVLAI